MLIIKYIFYLKTWHLKAVLFKRLVFQALCSALRLKSTSKQPVHTKASDQFLERLTCSPGQMVQRFHPNPICGMLKLIQKIHTDPLE